MSFPWKKDQKLLAEAKEIENKYYENEAIFYFGFQLGKSIKDIPMKDWHLHSRAQNVYPDAILFREDTKEVMNIEFEIKDSNFENKHHHDPSKCDLIVCAEKDKAWENPITVYELSTGRFYKPRK